MSTIPILLGLVLAVPANSDESVLGAAGLPATDKAILNFFNKRSQPPPGRAAIEQLARALGSNNPAEADDAHAELLGIGPPVVSVLRDVANRVDDSPRFKTGETNLANDRGASGRPPAHRCCPIARLSEIAGRSGGPVGLPARCGQRPGFRGNRLGPRLSQLTGRQGRSSPVGRSQEPKGVYPRCRCASVMQSWRHSLLEGRSAPADRLRPGRPVPGSRGAGRCARC